MQICSNCESEYDSVRHIPRILISCGHTFCQICIQLLIQDEIEAQQVQAQQQQTQAAAGGGRGWTNRGAAAGSAMNSANRKTTTGAGRKDNSTASGAASSSATPLPIVFECFECGIPCQVDPKLGVNALPKNMVLIPSQSMGQPSQFQLQQSSSETGGDLSTATGATKPTHQGRLLSKNTALTASVENVHGIGPSTGGLIGQASSLSQEESSLLNVDNDELSQSMSKGEDPASSCCKLHPTKKIEAFCEKDFKLLCIDCILSDRHKNHEIVSIAKASEKHCTYLRQQQESSIHVAQKLVSSKNEIQRHMQLMKLQAEANRRELSILYNAIRDMLMQREQALKTYISEVYQKEETQCQVKISQIEQALGQIDEYEEGIAGALEESDIDLLRRYSERKILVNTFNADPLLKELQQLNVSQFGLSSGPTAPATGSTSKGTASTKKAAAAEQQCDDQPPFQTLQEIRKDGEQLQVSKMINPNFKGQITNCSALLPWTRQPLDEPSGKGGAGANNNLYQQHTAASQLKVNKRAAGTDASSKPAFEKAGTFEEYVAPMNSTRPMNQYRRTTVAASGISTQQHQSNASPKPGENKRRTAVNHHNNAGGISVYGQSQLSSAKAESKQSTRQSYQIGSSRTHSYNLTNNNNAQFQNNSATTAKDNLANSQYQVKDPSAASSHINLFNQQQQQAAQSQQNAKNTGKRTGNAANTRQSQFSAAKTSTQNQLGNKAATISTQRVSLQEDTSLDLKQLSGNIVNQNANVQQLNSTSSDKNLGLKLQKQASLNLQQQSSSLAASTLVKQQRQARVAQEKQISDDLLNVQKQVNQVMSNLETFETKKRQLSAKKDPTSRGKMFQQRASPQQNLVQSAVNSNPGTGLDYKAKLEHGTSQRPLTNQLHKRNASSVQNSDSLNNSQIAAAARRMTSPPGKQQLQATQQPRQPAADNVIGNISMEQTASQKAAEAEEEDLPILHIKLDQQQQLEGNRGGSLGRQLSNPNEKLVDGSSDDGDGLAESSGILQQHTDQAFLPQTEPAQKPSSNHADFAGPQHQRIKSPIVRIDLNSNQAHSGEPVGEDVDDREDVVDEDDDDDLAGGRHPLGDQNFSARQHPIGGNDEDDTAEERIANMPDINNDSMVGDLNQLINDLNSGNPAAQLSARLRCQQLNVASSNVSTRKSVPLIASDEQKNNVNELLKRAHHAPEANNTGAPVKRSDNSFDNLQAKAMYFDPASSQAVTASAEAKTVDYMTSNNFASDGDYMASSASGGNRKTTTGALSGRSDNKSDSGQKKSQNKLKYIEQSAKAQQIQQNIIMHQQQQNNNNQQKRDRSRDDRSQNRLANAAAAASNPQQRSTTLVVPDLKLENLDGNAASANNFDLLKSDRSAQQAQQQQQISQQDPMVPTNEAGSKSKKPQQQQDTNASGQIGGGLLSLADPVALSGSSTSNFTSNPAANQVLSASSSAYSMNANSMSQASIDPFKALCQLRDEYIFVFSGFNERKLTHCEVFDAQRGIWKEIAHIQNPRTKFAAVPISKTRILIFGGKQADGQRTADIEEYNLKSNSFKTLPFKMPKARSGFAACIKRDEARIYFCGGNSGSGSNGSVLRKFDCLDLKKGKWTRLGDMLMKRDELSVAFGPDGNIYAIGGFGGGLVNATAPENMSQSLPEGASTTVDTTAEQQQTTAQQNDQFCQCLKEAERYNFATQQWDLLPPMKEARRALAAVVLPDGIYAIGGYDGRQYLATVEKFDLNRQEWVYVKSMNTARCTLSAVASTDCQYIYVLGGYNGKALNLVERYSVMNNTWELMPPMNVKRFMHQSVTLLRSEL